jgi:hypothetical protein
VVFVQNKRLLFAASLAAMSTSVLSCAEERLRSLGTVPTADAGPDRMVQLRERVDLVGDGMDPEGDPLTFEWSILSRPDGSTAALDSVDSIRTAFTVDVEDIRR